MRYRALLLFFVALFSVGAAYGYPTPVEKKAPPKKLTIAADIWCPINCNPRDEKLGVGIELAKEIYEPLGYTVNYVIMPWSQALEAVRKGKVDAVVGAGRVDDNTLVFPQSAIARVSDDFYVQAGDPWRFKSIDSLAGKRVGIIKEYGYGEEVKKFIAQNKANVGVIFESVGEEPVKQNVQRLLAGRIDVVIESRPVMEYTISKLKLKRQIRWAGSIPQGEVYLAFSPARPASEKLAALYDSGIEKLRGSYRLDAIYATYGLKPY